MVFRRQAGTKLGLALLFITLQQFLFLSQAQSDDQAQALLAIKEKVGGISTNLTSWNTPSRRPCLDKWIGVTCDDSNKIIGLNMSNCSLRGSLPYDAFSNLTSLISLDFSKNELNSSFPDLSQLKSLHDLRLEHNYFAAIPEEISNLQLLEALWLGYNNLSDPLPKGLASLTHLQIFSASGNFVNMELPPEWGIWTNITYLWESNCFDGNFTHDEDCDSDVRICQEFLHGGLQPLLEIKEAVGGVSTNLTSWNNTSRGPCLDKWIGVTCDPSNYIIGLNMSSFSLHGKLPPFVFSNLTTLISLDFSENSVESPLPYLSQLQSLQDLNFSSNILNESLPLSILNLTNLVELDFACNYLTGQRPTKFSNTSTWKGNCFDNDTDVHDEQRCGSGLTCQGPLLDSVAKKKSLSGGAIVGAIIGAIVVLGAILGLVCWARPGRSNNRRLRRKADKNTGDWTVPQGLRRFTYKEISKATKSFDSSCEIGEGGFGKVYVAQLDSGKHVAIKRASDLSCQGTKEFQNEITLLSRLHHRHLVKLEGFCDDRDEQILVYEYMSNGNLHRHLLDKHGSTLNWYRRLEIALAVAQGLDYLHTFANPPVIHRDVKPSNILLDENMIAKVSDFGISKANPEMDTHVSTRPAGTAGYLDPEYFLRRQLTTASDVYGYGVVLLELITGQLAINHKRLEDYNLVGWVKPKVKRQGIHAIIDPRLGPNFPAEQYEEIAHLAMGCTAFERGDRPTMQIVASTLERILSSLVPPPEHSVPVAPTSLSPLLIGIGSSSQFSGNRTEPLSDVKIDDGFTDTVVEPR